MKYRISKKKRPLTYDGKVEFVDISVYHDKSEVTDERECQVLS
jgi:hypothetical protein